MDYCRNQIVYTFRYELVHIRTKSIERNSPLSNCSYW